MPVSKKQLVRLVRLVACLKENRYPNCTRFSEEMRNADLYENKNIACTPRTIYRDIQTLKDEFSAPIEFDFKRGGYYLTNHKWNFSCPQIFEDSGMLSAVLGARVAEHIFPDPMKRQIRDAVDYLLTNNNPDFLDKAQVNSLIVIPSNRTAIEPEIFMPLFYAWQNHLCCKVGYRDSRGNESERLFEPHAMIFFEGIWYSKGNCPERKEVRTLVLSRMSSVLPLDKPFVPDKAIIASATEDEIFGASQIENAVVHCDAYLAKIVPSRPIHPDQQIILLESGECEIHIPHIPRYRLVTWIMHQCGRAAVVKPDNLQHEIIEFAEKLIEKQKIMNSTKEK